MISLPPLLITATLCIHGQQSGQVRHIGGPTNKSNHILILCRKTLKAGSEQLVLSANVEYLDDACAAQVRPEILRNMKDLTRGLYLECLRMPVLCCRRG